MSDYNLSQTGSQVQTILNKSYSKPAAGIPKTDLASGVRTSLDHADAAYIQSAANSEEIAELQDLYQALTQNDIVIVESSDWPISSGQQQNVIYRVTGTDSYSDYMWNGAEFIPMATYSNAYDAGFSLD